ncbi:MAG TPA: hypothetical protein PK514_03085 [Spirochaetota bacterium]|nr:hypothetical protein [Spirochaetota bacterium]
MKRVIFYLAAINAVLILNGCVTSPVCVTSSLTPLQGKTVTENLGECKGSDTAYSILGIYMIGRPDINLAIQEALDSKKGDTMINVRCYETYGYFLFFGTTTVTVEGDAVKFAEPAVADDKKGKGK